MRGGKGLGSILEAEGLADRSTGARRIGWRRDGARRRIINTDSPIRRPTGKPPTELVLSLSQLDL